MNRAQAEEFLYHEAALLDARRYHDWLALFLPDAHYWVPANTEAVGPEHHISIIYDDMDLLAERIRRLESPAHWADQPPARVLHQVGNVRVAPTDGGVRVDANTAIFVQRSNSQRRLEPLETLPAHTRHDLVEREGRWRIAFKQVTLLGLDGEVPILSFLL